MNDHGEYSPDQRQNTRHAVPIQNGQTAQLDCVLQDVGDSGDGQDILEDAHCDDLPGLRIMLPAFEGWGLC